ncbi:MAG: thymidine phosphorylase [Planctomycetales bacterium]|nr:thymidine phosphorylase [Planctomycetales bacterium]NIM08047.1 thymidine phosphorylase [Planctomycetales bacterium]NIN07538.1 thymidine phosphorylase [Planctomycetales bacterium]NIN76645.1 thymidine phosphorylase [Planctomycetales bacterium]NIO33833.1 thymidine phosphorylase [Planctomycetales bacterium]
MLPAEIIAKKRDGQSLTAEEIRGFIRGFSEGSIPDYQMAALAMAICIRGMSPDETAVLTAEMLSSGSSLERFDDPRPRVDKHSTGGLGDKVSLVLAPLLACCDLLVPMISGRGLGATGGTLDKLESIPGFRTDLSSDEIRTVTRQVGCVITGTTAELAPADKKLYALRDVTATIESVPLITSSIMSKKLAENLDALALDVKFGQASFMKTRGEARQLARQLIHVGTSMNLPTTALLTDMNQPLGQMIGNAVEVDEAVATLEGDGPADLVELVLALGAELLVGVGKEPNREEALKQLRGHLGSGRARQKFDQLVRAQGGDPDAPRPVATATDWLAAEPGYVTSIAAEQLGWLIIELGGGRQVMTDKIRHDVGVQLLVRVGDQVFQGQPLLRLFADPDDLTRVQPGLERMVQIGEKPVQVEKLIHQRLANDEPGEDEPGETDG